MRIGAVLALVLLSAACSGPPRPAHEVLWTGDLETGDLSQFEDAPAQNVGGTPPRLVTDSVRDGRYAVELTIPGSTGPQDGICCGSRNELLPRFRQMQPGDDLYFGFSTRLAPDFPTTGGWQVITQWKQNFDGVPPLSLIIEDGNYRLHGGYSHPAGNLLFDELIAPVATGEWVDWVFRVTFSPDPTVGLVQVWQGPDLVVPGFAPRGGTMYPDPNGPDGSYLKTGYYRDSTMTRSGTIYFDNWRIGTSRAAVAR